MVIRILISAMLAGAAIAAPVTASAAAQAERDWSRTVAMTPEGGYRMGNPDAPVKVIEFLSLTCPHCAHFSDAGMPPLIDRFVKSGRVSIEYRNFYLNGLDLIASLISRCTEPDDYFAINAAILRNQQEWVSRIQNLTPQQRQEMGALPAEEGVVRVASLTGLERIAAAHGVTSAELRACLADRGGMERLSGMKQAAERDFGIQGTPSFVINGTLAQNVHDWTALEPLLSAAAR